jgi:inhibitor of cysteine peptidase
VGESFTIHLPANPSTGYGWQAVFDSASIELVSQRFDRGAPNIGSGGDDVLTFRAVRQGRTTVTLELRRPWEKGSRESRRYEIVIDP